MLARVYEHFKVSEKRNSLKMKKSKSLTLQGLELRYHNLLDQLPEAESNLKNAESFFNNAEPMHIDNDTTYIDAAILNREAMQMRYGLLIKEMRNLYFQIETLKKNQ